MTDVREIRSAFLDYFETNGHRIVPSSPLVPRNDPTLMFVNAGMVQFKNVFTGLEKRDYSRAVTAQKCVRAGGKHNDLDNVGYTARHHTFFEMLGNFSFGDYFKDVAIELAWNLVTREFGLDKSRLLVTVYIDDDDAFGLWKKIAGLSDDRIIRIAGSDNFWAMGDTGPCGPCSEIFYDHGDHIPGGPPGSAEEDGDRFVEIWNLVFMQYEQRAKDDRVALPRPSIDTGMGLERMAAVLQGTNDNYETDLFKALIAASVDALGVPETAQNRASHRVIADHLRSTSFLIAENVLPSNEGRGYVLRRIMRRAMRHAHLLGAREPLMYRLVPALLHEMGQAYPELVRAQALITETLKLEETRFRKTLERGLTLLDEASAAIHGGGTLSGDVAFKLYDTYGFPLDLTQDALKARDIGVDIAGFDKAMERQRADARKAWAGSGDAAAETVWFEVLDRVGATEFLGYETEAAEGEVVALVRAGKQAKQLKKGDKAAIIVNQTPFYGESGGQVGDRGVIRTASGACFFVEDVVKRAGDLFVHLGTVEKGPFRLGDTVLLEVDRNRRAPTRANHSATHLLHEALRQVLGDHVAQRGSLVAPDRLRFDFAQPSPLTAEQLVKVEDIANAIVLQNDVVDTRLMDQEEAIASGARALFGEKYGDEVRVVAMGRANLDDAGGAKRFSVELCGGTHVARTGDIGMIHIVSESAVSSGVRRIEALTGNAAHNYLLDQEAGLRSAAAILKVKPQNVAGRVEALLEERRKLERQLAEARKKAALGGGGGGAQGEDMREIAGIPFLARRLEGVAPKDLRALVDEGKRTVKSGVVAIVGLAEDGKVGLVVGVTEDLVGSFDAVELVRAGAEAVGGKGGGGRADLAQAGGSDAGGADRALEIIAERVAQIAGATQAAE